ncbi:hypothetical protein OAT18_03020 [Tenacibaculum sp.]|nr:hypothetical protein [Tenacibaculum sp.]
MGKLKILIGSLFLFLFISCQNNDDLPVIDKENLLIGFWSNSVYKNNVITFSRVYSLPDNNYGISFNKKGNFIERSSGWCGTPPLFFSNYKGNWKQKNKKIQVNSVSPLIRYNWEIVSLSEDKLIIKRVLTDQEIDHQKIMTLFEELYDISKSITCNDSNSWSFTPYGSKACGGPKGYIAYSNEIDTVKFLQIVEKYTKLEDSYNKKWGVNSTCNIEPKPKKVNCVNGYPVLKY